MARPRSAADVIALSRVEDSDRALPGGTTIDSRRLGDCSLPLAKKRQRGNAEAPRKRRRGEQRGLCQSNIDELYIIFAYIYPMDLLNLARTCKSLRALLMHKSSSFLWKNALRQIEGLPGCPPDLVEPEYTNLVFYTRCHSCGKSANTVLWNIRRRYCPACRVERLFHLDACDQIIRENHVLPNDWAIVGEQSGRWVDRDQMDTFMREYHSSSDKTLFLDERREQHQVICSHASRCGTWQQLKGRVKRFDLEALRKERQECIFERLRQRGYGPELAYFADETIEKSYKSVFREYKPLMGSEWDRMWPKWAKIMSNFRSQRLEETLYTPRRRSLISEYEKYVMHPSPDTHAFDLLPHVVDLSRFAPFRDIIRAPEGTSLGDKPFASAFAQLPVLVGEWIQRLNFEIAGLVKIPSCLSSHDISGDRNKTSGTNHTDLTQITLDKLRLACAVFRVGGTSPFAHPEVLSVSMRSEMMFLDLKAHLDTFEAIPGIGDSGRTGSIDDRFGLEFLEEAPYIVHACGLDPHVATMDDMNRRNARLKCVSCEGCALVMNWKHAIWHARFYHCITVGRAPLTESPRWQLIGDEHVGAIQAVERSVKKALPPEWTRCQLCRPCVGDAMTHVQVTCHIERWHNVAMNDIKEGVHYKNMGIREACVVEMVDTGGQVSFRVPQE